jgi:hypothetical protein
MNGFVFWTKNTFPLRMAVWCFLWSLPASILSQETFLQTGVLASMGNIDLTGKPRLTIAIASDPVLSRLGFAVKLSHAVRPSGNAACRSEWEITGVRTVVYFDSNSNLVWVHPDCRRILFKPENRYENRETGWRASFSKDRQHVRLRHDGGREWTFQSGYLKSLKDSRIGAFEFKTDRESILNASKVDDRGAKESILTIHHTDAGLPGTIISGHRHVIQFTWSKSHCLAAIEEKPSGEATYFHYDNLLLTQWQDSKGMVENYTWSPKGEMIRNFSAGNSPVRLIEDRRFIYHYGSKAGIDWIRVMDKDGGFVSKTHFNHRGIVQHLP